MPISPENLSRYPANWKQIRAEILKRERNQCRLCFVKNHTVGYRDGLGKFHKCKAGHGTVRIVLTIAHLDHQPENNKPWNLAALCQRCHNIIDYSHRRANADATRRGKVDQGVFTQKKGAMQ